MGHPFSVAEFRELVSLALEACDPGHRHPFCSSPGPSSASPMHPLGASSTLDLPNTCMALQSSPSRPRARQVFAKLRQQASAFVRTPTKRHRSRSCNGDDDDGRASTLPLPLRRAPTVTFAPSAPRARSASFLSSAASSLQSDDASSTSDFGPFLPLASRLERASGSSDRRPIVPLPSPPPSVRSISTSSTHSPVTPVFTDQHHPCPSSSPTDAESPSSSDNDHFAKVQVQIVRRSLVQDSFMLACAAVDDDGGGFVRSPNISRRPSNAPLPPSKPPPSCPLPSPPSPTQTSTPSISSSSASELATPPDQEWTLFLGVPSKPLELPKERGVRERAKSSPSAPSPSRHLSPPPDIPTQFQKRKEDESARMRKVSTRSMATTRRIESGPGSPRFEDWTLSLPLRKKADTTTTPAEKPTTTTLEVPIVEPKTRKCKSFTDWTTSLSAEYEMEERRLVELEQRERERERKSSHVSLVSTKSARASSSSSSAASIQTSSTVKKQLPIGPGSSSNLNRAITNHSAPSTPISPTYIDHQAMIITSSASTSVSTLGKFPLPPPPSFSSQLQQRRQAVPPMPRPLMPTTSVVLRKQFGSPTSYVGGSASPTTTLAPPLVESLRGLRGEEVRGPLLGVPGRKKSYGELTMMTSRNSSRTVSAASTVKMPFFVADNHIDDDNGEGESSRKSSMEECYETCDEGGGLSPVAWDVEETASNSSGDVFWSARSSLDL